MLAVVKTPLIKIKIEGKISKKLLTILREEYGSDVQIVPQKDDEKQDVFETDWYKSTRAKMTPGKNLRIYRQNKNMTQQELGNLLGAMPRQHISNMEKGIRSISKKVALKLSKIFNTSVEKFIG